MSGVFLAMTRVYAIMLKEFRQLSRDRLTFGMVVMIPLIQLMLFGYAINNQIRHISVGVVDEAQSAASRLVIDAVRATQVVDFIESYYSVQEAEMAITAGAVRAVLVLPHDLEQRAMNLAQPRPIGQWLVDGADNVVASALLSLRSMPVSLHPRGLDGQRTVSAAVPVTVATTVPTFETVLYYNPERRTPVNIVPGLLAVILTMTMILFTATAIVREKERGNLELLITTPLRSFELMLGKIVPYVLIGLVQMSIILSLGHYVFAVPINGRPEQIVAATLLFIAASLTLGLIISTVAKNQLQAMQMTVFVLLPSILLSGFLFPYEGMPPPAQWLAETLPATHFVRMIRGVVLRDASLDQLSADALFLLIFTFAGLFLATVKFRKSLD